MKTKTIVAAFAALTGASALADTVPSVSNVTMAQDSSSRRVTITYKLDAPAVVTLDVQTNATENADSSDSGWTSIGGDGVWNASGDVWKLVNTNASESFSGTITWRPDLAWPDHKIEGSRTRAVVTAWCTNNTPDYMVVNLALAKGADGQLMFYPGAEYLPKSDYSQTNAVTQNAEYKTNKLVMRKIMAEGITWTKGTTSVETQRFTNELTHAITLADNYYIGIFEITQRQWLNVTNQLAITSQPSQAFTPYRTGDKKPITNAGIRPVTGGAWDTTGDNYYKLHTGSFCGCLATLTGLAFDLPCDSQWEFAARAGHGTGYWGDGSAIQNTDSDSNLDNLAKYDSAGAGRITSSSTYTDDDGPAEVGSYAPNDWGLYDMFGNVWEWTLDPGIASGQDELANFANSDGSPIANSTSGVNGALIKGGSWTSPAKYCRPGYRRFTGNGYTYCGSIANIGWATNSDNANDVGFRVVCPVGITVE